MSSGFNFLPDITVNIADRIFRIYPGNHIVFITGILIGGFVILFLISLQNSLSWVFCRANMPWQSIRITTSLWLYESINAGNKEYNQMRCTVFYITCSIYDIHKKNAAK
jgi:hypothetical protein